MSLVKKEKPLHWTSHSKYKMRFYGLSENRVKRVINHPGRIEEGIAPKTIAMMQPAGSAKHPYEIWIMLQDEKSRRKIISAWRYPGKTKPSDIISFQAFKREYSEFEESGGK
ncbi:MAG: hypothetical protein HY432_03705 [Candidatus Liptonbacteria bacterium]|nr:hypothetical protein [Candidatus Liptonbacteria bacterium]